MVKKKRYYSHHYTTSFFEKEETMAEEIKLSDLQAKKVTTEELNVEAKENLTQVEVKVTKEADSTKFNQTTSKDKLVKEKPAIKEVQDASSKPQLDSSVEFFINQYRNAMNNKVAPVPEEGAKRNYSLFKFLISIINSESQVEFNKKWNSLLYLVNQYKDDTFALHLINRFPAQWPGTDNEFTLYKRLTFIILESADPSTRRKQVANINLDILTQGLTENQKAKLIAFYS